MTHSPKTRAEEIAEQTSIRRALLALGYTPLGNIDKRCMLPGWPSLDVTDDVITGWGGSYALRATGVRLDNGLAVADFDIDDDDAIRDIVMTMPDDLWSKLEHAPCRHGKGAKEAWFFRVSQPFSRYCSATFHPPGAAEDAPTAVLEVFGGASARQFGAYGAHTVSGGRVERSYRWADQRGLTRVPLADLPVLDEADVAALCEHVTRVLKGRGWVPDTAVRLGKTTEQEVFDLTDDMVFEAADGPLTMAELIARCDDAGTVRVSASWLLGPSAVNTTRCLASLRHDGSLQILETAEHVLHRSRKNGPAGTRPGDMETASRLLGSAPAGSMFGSAGADGATTGSGGDGAGGGSGLMEQIVSHLRERYALCVADKGAPVYPLDGTTPLSFANFKMQFAPYIEAKRGKRGGVTETHPADLWLRDPDRRDVLGRAYRPDAPGQGMVEGWINTYRAPVHDGAAQGDSALFWPFLEHLLPDAAERAWFVNKLAAKVQRPHVPGVAALMVATRQGTGRGTLFSLISALVGHGNAITLERSHLTGEGSQGQYTAWRADHVVGFVHELLAAETGGGHHWRRMELYERIKTLADPAHAAFTVVQKYAPDRPAVSYMSLFIATNHLHALPLQADDRRIAVLTCGDRKLSDAPALAGIHACIADPAFVAAVWQDLQAVDVDWRQVMDVPLFGGRAAMINENQSELDQVVADVLERVPGDFITFGALRDAVGKALRAQSMDDEPKWKARIGNMLAMPHNPTGWVYSRTRRKFEQDGARFKAAVVARTAAGGFAAFDALSMPERGAALDPATQAGQTAAQKAATRLGLTVIEND